jgi:hypothetical protein
MRNVKVTLAVGILLIAGVGAVTLTRSPVRVLRASGARDNTELGVTIGDTVICQPGEVLPGGVSAIRLPVIAFYGSQVSVIVFRGSQVLTEGARGPNWTGVSVTVPVRPVAETISDVKICFALAPNSEPLIIPGYLTSPAKAAVLLSSKTLTPTAATSSAAVRLKGGVALEYLASGRKPWWSRVLTVARHMGLGRNYSGTWIVLLVAALMAVVGALAIRLTLRELP